jgi:VanZ family protein
MADTERSRDSDVGGPRLTLLLWLAAVAALLVLSLWPSGSEKHAVQDGGDNVIWTLAHIPAYALVAALTVPLAYGWLRESVRALMVSLIFACSLGIALEVVQPLVGRTADVSDVALNLLGAFLAIGAWTGGRVLPPAGVRDPRRGTF